MVAPTSTQAAVQVTGPYAPVAAIPVVTGGQLPPVGPAAPLPVVVVTAGSMPMAPVQPIPMKMLTAGTPTAAVMPIPVIIVG